MKLFGSRRRAAYAKKSARPAKRHVGLIVAAIFLLLCGGVAAAWTAFVRPVERPAVSQPETTPAQTEAAAQSEDTLIYVTPQPEEQTQPDEPEEETVETEQPKALKDGVYNILICGTDEDGTRTDTIIVAHLDANTHTVALLSIPRDTPVYSGSGLMKINSVYGGAGDSGMERLCSRLNELLGFPMDGYVLVDLTAFQKTVELVGGVEFDVPQDMYYSDPTQNLYIDLKAGRQTLNGEQAMGLVRYRKGYASQDIQRTKVQQEFLRALAKQCLSVSSLTKIKEFADIFSTYVTTDLSVGNMLYFAQALMQCDFDAMKTYTLEGEGAMINGVSYYPLYAGKLVSVVNEAFNPYDAPVTLDTVNVITPDIARTYQIKTEPEEAENAELPDETETPPDAPETDEMTPEEDQEAGVILPEEDAPEDMTPEDENLEEWFFPEEFRQE